jgi:uncharacterized protein (DUF58 family)
MTLFVNIVFWSLTLLALLLVFSWYVSGAGQRSISTAQWAQVTFLLLLAGLIERIPLIAIPAALVLLTIGIARVWRHVILIDVHYERTFERTHLFPDEEMHVTWTIQNEKPVPISWLRWQEAIHIRPFAGGHHDEGIHLNDIEVRSIFDGSADGVDEITALGAFQTLIKTTAVRALRRGFYQFGPVELQASDPLGLYTATTTIDNRSGVVVYPRLYTLEELEIPATALLGDVRQRQSFVEDPSWYRGARRYQPADPMKLIDWNLTARTHELQVKLFEPTAHSKLMVIANLRAFEHIWEGIVSEYMENVISTAGSIARWALEGGFEVGLHTNGALPGTEVPLRILPSAADDQLFVILDYLARIMLVVERRVEDLLETDARDLPHGCTLVVCTSVVTGALITTLTDIAQRQRVLVVLVSQPEANKSLPVIPNVTVIHARPGRAIAA